MARKVDGVLSQDEIDALLAGVDMSSGKSIVVTAYGHDDVIDKIAISTFDCSSGHYMDNENAHTYCDMLNALEFNGNSWVYAKVVPENTPFSLIDLIPVKFPEIILAMNDGGIQKVLREIDKQDLAKALKGCNDAVLKKVFKNVSSRFLQMLKEDMEYLGPIRRRDVIICQEKILSVIRHLNDIGEIVLLCSREDVVV